jgi:hypothetical protein
MKTIEGSAGEKPEFKEKPLIQPDIKTPSQQVQDVVRWTSDPMILTRTPTELFVSDSFGANRNSNALARLIIVIHLVWFGSTRKPRIIWQGMIAVMLSSLVYKKKDTMYAGETYTAETYSAETVAYEENGKDPEEEDAYSIGPDGDDDIRLTSKEAAKLTVSPRSAPGRQELRPATNTSIFSTHVPIHYPSDDIFSDNSMVGPQLYVSRTSD